MIYPIWVFRIAMIAMGIVFLFAIYSIWKTIKIVKQINILRKQARELKRKMKGKIMSKPMQGNKDDRKRARQRRRKESVSRFKKH